MSLIVTFYSFKGGVGRSMALANIGILLAQRGVETLLVDWDLEAPGLQQYFSTLSVQPSAFGGMLDLLLHASFERKDGQTPDWRNYVSTVDIGQGGRLSLITSGQSEKDDSYAARLAKLDWSALFADHDGGAFIENLRAEWRDNFAVTLIDSRTGLTDAGGVCTIQMPDVLVAVFTPNDQNLNGIADVLDKAQRGRQQLAYDRMPLLVVPLPSRFDSRAEFEESQLWLEKIAKKLASRYDDWLPTGMNVKQVLELTKVPYVAFFSYGEKLPVLTHGTTDPEGIGYYYEKIASLLETDFRDVDLIFPTGDRRAVRQNQKALEGERLRRRIERAAAAWEEHQRDDSWLWRGEELDDARRLRETGTLDLDQRETEFLAASLEVREKEDERQSVKGRGFLGEPFKCDVYVSYSHGAFKGQHEDSDLKLWSQRFANDLRAELAGTPEFEEVSVFLDQSDRADESFYPLGLSEYRHERVESSALLVILMTPHYLRSEWCRQELEWWCAKHHPDILGAGNRIFVCRLRPSDEGTWPEPLKDVVGYFCYDRNREPDKARPFTWRGSTRDLDDYNDLLVDLAGDIMRRLRTIRGVLEQRWKHDAAAARLAAGGGQVLYLHARQAHAEAWERVGDALVDSGFVVLPAEPDPIAREPTATHEIAERRIETMSGCDGLLLLGTRDGRALDADLVVVGRQDRHLARARSNRLLPCAVVNTDGTEVATPTRRAMARALGVDWIDATRDGWPAEVSSWLIEASTALKRV